MISASGRTRRLTTPILPNVMLQKEGRFTIIINIAGTGIPLISWLII